MPLYEYRCESCNQTFEVRQKFSDEPLSTHEGCGGKVVRLLTAPGLQFKGSGWYITDYARAGSAKSEGKAESKSESKPGTDTKTSTPSESKPASAPAKTE